MVNVLTRESADIAREAQDALQKRDVQGLAIVSLGIAGGVVVAQELADRVLPALGFSRTPSSATGFAASGGVKFVAALVVGTVAAQLSGLGLAVAAFAAIGHLAGAGADFINAVQRTGLAAEATRGQRRRTSTTSSSTTSSTPSASSANGASAGGATVTAG